MAAFFCNKMAFGLWPLVFVNEVKFKIIIDAQKRKESVDPNARPKAKGQRPKTKP
jgi:hypothetical protein